MMLGDLITRLQDETLASETLLSLVDLALAARIVALAAESNITAGELTAQTVDRFVNSATDEEWLTLMGQMSRAENPGQLFLRRVLSNEGPA